MDNKRIEAALKAVALEICPRDYWLHYEDVKTFNDALSRPSDGKGTYSCQSNLGIRVYNRQQVKDGASYGGVAGIAGGTIAGIFIGASAGSVVPVVGNVIGGVIGGIAGFMGGGLGGAGIGAGIGSAVSNDEYVTIYARNIFEQLPGFREMDNVVYCELH